MTGSARNKIITTGCAGALSLALVASSLAITSSRASGAGTALLPKFTGSSETIATYHYGSSRSGDDRQDPSLAGAVLAWHTPGSTIHGDVYAEPLLDKGLVVVATEDDMVYALNASTGTVHWKASVGAPVQPSVLEKAPTLNSQCGDIFPLGITSTPVIQESTGTIFVAAEVQRSGSTAWQGIEHELFAISISSGKVLWHRQIDPPGAGDGSRGTYVIPALQQRSALTLVGSSVYVEYGGLSGDCGAYHGFVVSLPSSGRGVLVTYRTPSSREDAIWATSGAVTDGAGNLFVATGNGANGPGQPFDFGDAVVKLSPALKVLSYFAPTTWAQLSAADLDIGSGGPIILPDGKTLFEVGKPGYASKSSSTLTSLGWLLSTSLGGIGHSEYRGT
ncbi:MAG: PQQ-binding-like beta-propeller repeat protein, partial [Acidimicrobiales bacterium]